MFASCTPFFNRREMAWTAEFPDNDEKREMINSEMFFRLAIWYLFYRNHVIQWHFMVTQIQHIFKKQLTPNHNSKQLEIFTNCGREH
jgi:hypothetical protein